MNGKQLRDQGIKRAEDHANSKIEKWSDKAFSFLKSYIKTSREFMAEDVRLASIGAVEEPPSSRAWGAVIVRAVKAGLIERKGYRAVKNKKAHKTPATLWSVK